MKALPGNPYDGHTLAAVIPDMEALVGNTIARIFADKGYRGHNAPPDYKFRVFLSGQKRGVTPQDQARIAPQVRCRARHRPSQSRASHGPQLSLVPSRRRRQRRPRRCQLQLPPPDPLAQPLVVPNPDGTLPAAVDQSRLKSRFFTDDYSEDALT